MINNIEIKYCITYISRLKGFMLTKKMNNCLCFPKCNSIHTFFMLKPIDIVMTDKNYNVLHIYKNFKPFKIILPKKNVYYVFEFPVGKVNFKINEKIKVK